MAALGAASWTYRASFFAGVQPPVPSGVHMQRPETRIAVMPGQTGNDFDGIWEFQLFGGESCAIKTMTFRRKIFDGIVMTNDGRKLGTVGNDGRFHFSNPSPVNQNVMVESQGTINGDTGQGSYSAIGTPCQGIYKIRLVEKR